jgi:hypothetical protein
MALCDDCRKVFIRINDLVSVRGKKYCEACIGGKASFDALKGLSMPIVDKLEKSRMAAEITRMEAEIVTYKAHVKAYEEHHCEAEIMLHACGPDTYPYKLLCQAWGVTELDSESFYRFVHRGFVVLGSVQYVTGSESYRDESGRKTWRQTHRLYPDGEPGVVGRIIEALQLQYTSPMCKMTVEDVPDDDSPLLKILENLGFENEDEELTYVVD